MIIETVNILGGVHEEAELSKNGSRGEIENTTLYPKQSLKLVHFQSPCTVITKCV